MLDRLSPQWRHALILLIGAVLTYASQELPNVPADWRPLIGAAVGIGTLIFTPLTRQYGVGSGD